MSHVKGQMSNVFLYLRLGLGIVFFLFGIDKFLRPDIWIGWYPGFFFDVFSNRTLIWGLYIQGVVEAFIGLSFFLDKFAKYSAFLGAVIIALVIVFSGFNTITIRDIGLLGGLLALYAAHKDS